MIVIVDVVLFCFLYFVGKIKFGFLCCFVVIFLVYEFKSLGRISKNEVGSVFW